MGLESASYISQLQPLNPDGADDINQGDNHIRLVKSVLQTQFPNFTAAAVTATVAELNYVDGVTSAIQTQIDAKAPIASPSLTGTPLTVTPSGSTPTQIANVSYVDTKVATVSTITDLVNTSVTGTGTITIGTRELCAASGAITRTVPSGAAVGALFGYKDAGQDFSTNKMTLIPPSGHQFEWAAVDEAMEVTTRGESGVLCQTSAGVWRFIG